MKLKAKSFLFLVAVVTDLSRTVSSFDSKCPPLNFVSGRSRYQWRGRSVRFNCNRGFQLVGVKYATCMNGKWDAEVPICVKYGCHAPSTSHVNGQFIESYRGAVVKIVCNPGYGLVGSPSVYCNGYRWNETFPVCRVTNSNPALSCSFEGEDLCGWSQDPMHDFDWKRRDGSTSSGDPEPDPGHYMYIESSSPRMENDTARFFSPVYPPHFSNGTCFKFRYHMHGPTTGFLKVYVKPEGTDLCNLIPSFWMNGDQAKTWTQAFFPVEPVQSPFQIVFEAVRGFGPAGSTAFDDVSLTSAEECTLLQAITTSTEFTSSAGLDDDASDLFTCKNRCHQEKLSATAAEEDRCNCHESCEQNGICCSDYFELCSASPPASSATAQIALKISTSSPSPPTFPPFQHAPIHFNNETNEIDPINPFASRNQPQPITSRTTPVSTTTRLVSKPATNRIRPDSSRAVVPKTVLTKGARAPVPGNGTGAGTRAKADTTPQPMSTTSSSAVTATARLLKNPNLKNIKLPLPEKPSNPSLSNDLKFIKGRPKEVSGKEPPQAIKIDNGDDNGGGGGVVPVRGVLEFGGTALAVFVVVLLVGLFCHRRRQLRKSERDGMVEDSDSIIYEMESSALGTAYHSLVCIRPGGLGQSL